MTDTTHTPGPWRTNGQAIEAGPDEGTLYIARAYGESDGASVEDPQAIHNARLIASAPDLLEALEHIADVMQSASSSGDPVSPEWLDRRIKVARATIQKALGHD